MAHSAKCSSGHEGMLVDCAQSSYVYIAGEWKEGARHGRGEYVLADGTW
jgi:hypothetical protein